MRPYVPSFLSPIRRLTREVRVGNVVIGGKHPVVVQSMTTTPTTDTIRTVDQIERLVNVGCEIVRVTTPGVADVENLPNLRVEMKRRGITVPLAADVHFLPELALRACDLVEKVRINPGNLADRKKFVTREYTDSEYESELARIRTAFLPIVRRAKERGVALRIGTNHGSLSDRILNRFGDTPLGMVESALEFVRIAEEERFHEIVISMKASNPVVMIQAYRLLVARMDDEKMNYPLHLGVTEAGDGEEGRVKSALGIGALLSDGLGDTIRVSLTEESEAEIPVARTLLRHYERGFESKGTKEVHPTWDPYSYARRLSEALHAGPQSVGGRETVRVRTELPKGRFVTLEPPIEAAVVDSPIDLPDRCSSVLRPDSDRPLDLRSPTLRTNELSIRPSNAWLEKAYAEKLAHSLEGRIVWIRAAKEEEVDQAIRFLRGFRKIQAGLELEGRELISLGRSAVAKLAEEELRPPIHLRYTASSQDTADDLLIRVPTEIGSLLCDGIGDSVEVSSREEVSFNHRLSFGVLQAARVRMSKTEYIACPSCGRTLFDLQTTTARIRSQTGHLKGLKIAIMGCIVNGPGEMADADFGYVGSGPGHINLYVGRECIERQIPESEADGRLIDLIRRNGRWIDPPS
ncbi:MAG: (E)-4-hydroxy-3-methylbut-2-enyl-diphosphate synthase [Pseudomonadota bacterium]